MSDADDLDAGAPDPLEGRIQTAKRPSGAQQRKERKQRLADEADRERERNGTDAETRDLIAKLGEPPLDPVLNAAWANNAAAVMASITLRDETIPRETRFKQVADFLDRIAATTVKAHQSKRIADLQAKAGVKTPPQADAARVVPIHGSGALRAGSRIQRGTAVSGSVPFVPPKIDG